MNSSQRALVLFSGGQDSTTCLAWALDHFNHVETIGFNYGQRHHVELDCRLRILKKIKRTFPQWQTRLGEDHLLDLTLFHQIGQSAMTSEMEIKMLASGMPNTFVPGRNLLFFSAAASLAYRRELTVLVGGMCETDYSGYPDCRDDTIKALQVTLNLGMAQQFILATPLMWLNKAKTWALAKQIGGQALLDLIIEDTHTCYLGERNKRHEWGYGCGACPACELRSHGFIEFQHSSNLSLANES